MASLDFESLFTNIPLEETIDNIINDLYLSTEKVHNFEKHELKNIPLEETIDNIINDFYFSTKKVHNFEKQ